MTPAMIGALVGWFLPMVPSALTTPVGKWSLLNLLLSGYGLRFIFAVVFGVAAKVMFE